LLEPDWLRRVYRRRILMRTDAGSELCFLFGKHANDASSDFVKNYGLVVFADNVNVKLCLRKWISERRD
jgi:hypothetical protein